jgi:hypothetical protein
MYRILLKFIFNSLLCQSDGHAVRELYPVLKMLYEGFKERQRGQQQRPKRTVITAGGQQQQPVDIGEAEEDSVQISALRSQVNAKVNNLFHVFFIILLYLIETSFDHQLF